MARNFLIEGGSYSIDGPRAGIWVNGLGQPGAGASNVRIVRTHIDMGANGLACIKVSGAGYNIMAANFTCLGGAGTVIYSGHGGDVGGSPSRVVFFNGRIDGNRNKHSSALINIESSGTIIERVRVTNSIGYTFGMALMGLNGVSKFNIVPPGTKGTYTRLGRGSVIVDGDPGQR
jgi:hypothetical protein